MIEKAQLLERYRHLSRDIQNSTQSMERSIANSQAKNQPVDIDFIDRHLEVIKEAWQDFSGWILISTLDNLEEARLNCAAGRIDVNSKIIRASKRRRLDIERKGLHINLNGVEKTILETYIQYFEQAIDLMLENAIKYSPMGNKIEIETQTKNGEIAISICSTGPMINKIESRNIGEKGFRSENAKKLNSIGQGYGIYNLNRLANLLDGKILINPSYKVIYEVSKVPQALFEITLKIPLSPIN